MGAVIVVALGAFQAIIAVIGAIFSGNADELRGREIWLKFATWILLALEFALAADIVHTAVAPTWEDIWKLAVIAVIRTMLNYGQGHRGFHQTPGFWPNSRLKARSILIRWTVDPFYGSVGQSLMACGKIVP